MAGNTRGKLKEHFQGIHKNYDWIKFHCEKCIALIDGRKPELSEALGALAELTETLDKELMELYSHL